MASEFPVSSFVQKHSRELPDALGKLMEAKLDEKDLSLLKWEEIGDGNLNFVYRIWLGPPKEDAAMNDGSDITAVIKFAPEYIRVRESLEERRGERTCCKIVLKFELAKSLV